MIAAAVMVRTVTVIIRCISQEGQKNKNSDTALFVENGVYAVICRGAS
jgi:hypothetical protein